MYTLARSTNRSRVFQPSSTAPEEKNRTWYGIITEPSWAMAKYR
jgi:hypothetical protein